jgi:putative PIN family toxin of toxin-antitoxin system
MRVVADTNTVVSGLLWSGRPRALIDAARSQAIALLTSPTLLEELTTVLARAKFQRRIQRVGTSVPELLTVYRELAEEITPADIPPTILSDPDDDAVLAAALGGQAELIVSGDAHLLNQARFLDIPIVTVAEALLLLAKL